MEWRRIRWHFLVFSGCVIIFFLILELKIQREVLNSLPFQLPLSSSHKMHLIQLSQKKPILLDNLRRHRQGMIHHDYKHISLKEPIPLIIPKVSYSSHYKNSIINNNNNDSLEEEEEEDHINWTIDTRFVIKEKHYFPNTTKFLIDPYDLCIPNDKNEIIKGVVFIISAPGHLEERILQRTIYPPPKHFRRIFLIGLPVINSHAYTTCFKENHCSVDRHKYSLLIEESKHYKDLLITSDFDTYQFLTFKTIAMFRWATTRCSNALFVFKVDEDILLNYKAMEEHIDQYIAEDHLELRWIGVRRTYHAMRYAGKNIISYDKYPGEIYPYYAGGPRYFMSLDTAELFSHMTSRIPFLPIEDVWVGIAGFLLGLNVENYTGASVDSEYNETLYCKLPFIENDYQHISDVLTAWKRCNALIKENITTTLQISL